MAIADPTALLASPAPAAAPRLASSRVDPTAARKSAEDFTAFFFTQSLETIYSGISSDTLFGGGSGENIYRSLLTQEYGKMAARSGGMGIADSVQREILRMQEAK
jgi:Rod binding domain-containing protein